MASVKTNVFEGRYIELKVEELSYSVEKNTSDIRWTLSVLGGESPNYDAAPTKAVVNGTVVYETKYVTTWDTYQFPAVKGSVSGDMTVSHGVDGKKTISFSLSGRVYYHTPATSSGTLKLTDIPRASKVSAADTILGENCAITLDKAVSEYTTTVSWAIGSKSGDIATKSSGVKINWVPQEALAEQFPNSATGECTITAKTYKGNTLIGTESTTIQLIPPKDMVPTITGLLAERVDGAVPAEWGIYVQNKSRALLTAQGFAGVRGSSIKSVVISGDGRIWESSQVLTGFIKNSGEVTFQCTVTDSRGRSNTASVTLQVAAYSAPYFSFATLFRCNETGEAEDGGVWLYGRATAVCKEIGDNAVSMKIGLYSAAGSLVQEEAMQSNVPTIIGGNMSGQLSYRAMITATDRLGEKAEYSVVIPTESVAFTMMPGGKGAAFQKYATRENALELPENWMLYFGDTSMYLKLYPVGAVCMRSDSTNPGTVFGGTWAEITQTAVSGVKLWKRTA